MKKSNGLTTVNSAIRSTAICNERVRSWENQSCQEIAVRILLPILEMLGRLDRERIAQDRRATMRGRAQSDSLRREGHRTVVIVTGFMVQRNSNGHGSISAMLWLVPLMARLLQFA